MRSIFLRLSPRRWTRLASGSVQQASNSILRCVPYLTLFMHSSSDGDHRCRGGSRLHLKPTRSASFPAFEQMSVYVIYGLLPLLTAFH